MIKNSNLTNKLENETPEKKSTDLDFLKGFTILIVDKDYNILLSIAKIFQSYGIKVLTEVSATSAFEMIKKFSVDLLISDINTTGEDGYWLVQKVREITLPRIRNKLNFSCCFYWQY